MKNSRAFGAEKPPLQFEVVPLPVLPAHDRLPAVPVTELPDYAPLACPLGHKAALAIGFADTVPSCSVDLP